MKLAIIIVILTFCYCGSLASPYGCNCDQRGDMESEYPAGMNSIQPIVRRDEPVQQLWEDPSGTQKENLIKRKEREYYLGFANGGRLRSQRLKANSTSVLFDGKLGGAASIPPRLGRGFLKPNMVRLLREYAQEPEYVDGWTYGNDKPAFKNLYYQNKYE